jgi:hypothetical protein
MLTSQGDIGYARAGCERVGYSALHEIGRAAVHRLVQRGAATILLGAQRGRRKHAERAGRHGGAIRQDVAEKIIGHDHVLHPMESAAFARRTPKADFRRSSAGSARASPSRLAAALPSSARLPTPVSRMRFSVHTGGYSEPRDNEIGSRVTADETRQFGKPRPNLAIAGRF